MLVRERVIPAGPPAAWMLCVFRKDKRPGCAVGTRAHRAAALAFFTSPGSQPPNCFGSQALSRAAAYAACVPEAKIKSHPPPPLLKFNNKMELSPLPINCLF